jgi:hypothetical protein
LLCPLPPLTLHLGGDVILFCELLRAHLQGCEPREAPGDGRVLYALGMKLLVDVDREADATNRFDLSGTRTETDPVQHVDDRLIVG